PLCPPLRAALPISAALGLLPHPRLGVHPPPKRGERPLRDTCGAAAVPAVGSSAAGGRLPAGLRAPRPVAGPGDRLVPQLSPGHVRAAGHPLPAPCGLLVAVCAVGAAAGLVAVPPAARSHQDPPRTSPSTAAIGPRRPVGCGGPLPRARDDGRNLDASGGGPRRPVGRRRQGQGDG